MNQPPRQETNSQTFFPKPTRNSKTVVKKYKFPALGSSWQLVHIAFLLPCSCWKLLGCYFGCCCCAASAAAAATACHTSCHAAAAGSCWALLLLLLFLLLYCSCICCCFFWWWCRCWRLLMLLLLLLPCHEPRHQQPDIFSKPTRNSKTPPNFVPKMTRNHSQEQAPRRPERPF